MKSPNRDPSSVDISSSVADPNETILPASPANNDSLRNLLNTNNEPLEYPDNFDDTVSISSSVETCYPLLSYGRDNNVDSPGRSPVSDINTNDKPGSNDKTAQPQRDTVYNENDSNSGLQSSRPNDGSHPIESDSVAPRISVPELIAEQSTPERPPSQEEADRSNQIRQPAAASAWPEKTHLRSILKVPTTRTNQNPLVSGPLQKRVHWTETPASVRTYVVESPEPCSWDMNEQPIWRVKPHLDRSSFARRQVQQEAMPKSSHQQTSGSSQQTRNQHLPGTLQSIEENEEEEEQEELESRHVAETNAGLTREKAGPDENSSSNFPHEYTSKSVGVVNPPSTNQNRVLCDRTRALLSQTSVCEEWSDNAEPNLSAYQIIHADHPSRQSSSTQSNSHFRYQQHPRALHPYYGPPGPRIDPSLPDRDSSLRCHNIHTAPSQHRWYCTIDDREMNKDEAEERRDQRENYFKRKLAEDEQRERDLEYQKRQEVKEQELAEREERLVAETAVRLAREKAERDAKPPAYVPRVFTSQFTNLDSFARIVSSCSDDGHNKNLPSNAQPLSAEFKFPAQKLVPSVSVQRATMAEEPIIRRCRIASEVFAVWKKLPDGREIKVFREQEDTPEQWQLYHQRHRAIQYEAGCTLNQSNLDKATGFTIIPVPLANPAINPNFAVLRVQVAEAKNDGLFGKYYVAEFSLSSITWEELRAKLQEHYCNGLPIYAIDDMQRVDFSTTNRWLNHHNTFFHVAYPSLGYNFLSAVHGDIENCMENRRRSCFQLLNYLKNVEKGCSRLEATDY